jgi:uncharacterized protein YkvS
MKLSAIVISFIFISVNVFAAEKYSVTKLNEEGTRAIVKGKANTLSVGDYLAVSDEFGEGCSGKVVKINNDSAAIDISNCKNAKGVKVGTEMSVSSAPSIDQPMPGQRRDEVAARKTNGPTADEDWYTLWGLGFSKVDYDDEAVNDILDYTEDLPGVDRATINVDIFGFYWPTADRKSMHGFMGNVVADSLDGPGGTLSINQNMYAYSYHRFYGANIGDGWFLRGDIGLVKYVLSFDSKDILVADYEVDSDFGIGLLGGGGYGWGIGAETRMLLGAYLTHRNAEGDAANSFNVTLGFLF